jgi:hypothetical protein
MAVLANEVASQVVERLGLKYNHNQEVEADLTAIKVLDILGYKHDALATALNRIKQYFVTERMNVYYFASYTHPALESRIRRCGKPDDLVDKEFEQIVSFAVTNVANMKFEDRRFKQCIPYLKQNIENQVAMSDDYILMANCLLNTQNTEASNQEAIDYIRKAKTIDEKNINIYKVEVIAKLRQNKKAEAINLLNTYIDNLESMNALLHDIQNENLWAETRRFIYNEQYWAKQMLIKLNAMN